MTPGSGVAAGLGVSATGVGRVTEFGVTAAAVGMAGLVGDGCRDGTLHARRAGQGDSHSG